MIVGKVSFLLLQLALGFAVQVDCQTCPEQYQLFEDNCYRFFETINTWQGAEDVCMKEISPGGLGHLAAIHSQQENDFVTKLWRDSNPPCTGGKSRVWLGFNDIKLEGSFVLTDGQPFNFNQWLNGQPNNLRKNQDCVNIIRNNKHEIGWNDDDCKSSFSFICKIPADNP